MTFPLLYTFILRVECIRREFTIPVQPTTDSYDCSKKFERGRIYQKKNRITKIKNNTLLSLYVFSYSVGVWSVIWIDNNCETV